MKCEMGQKVKDVITGFSGVVTGKAQYITGCQQVLVVPPVKSDGDSVSGQWLDEDRLEVVDQSRIELPVTSSGPDMSPSRSL